MKEPVTAKRAKEIDVILTELHRWWSVLEEELYGPELCRRYQEAISKKLTTAQYQQLSKDLFARYRYLHLALCNDAALDTLARMSRQIDRIEKEKSNS